MHLAAIAALWIAALLLYRLEERREGRSRPPATPPAVVELRDDRLV